MTDIDSRADLYNLCRATWGEDAQIDVAIEEMMELSRALLKLRRTISPGTVGNVLEEIADVQIMLEQLAMIFDPKDEGIEDIKTYKLNRLYGRLKAAAEGEASAAKAQEG